ncbi:MAG: hypothetical protein QXN33_00240 [Candidatus Bathyarchaeia archaeon]
MKRLVSSITMPLARISPPPRIEGRKGKKTEMGEREPVPRPAQPPQPAGEVKLPAQAVVATVPSKPRRARFSPMTRIKISEEDLERKLERAKQLASRMGFRAPDFDVDVISDKEAYMRTGRIAPVTTWRSELGWYEPGSVSRYGVGKMYVNERAATENPLGLDHVLFHEYAHALAEANGLPLHDENFANQFADLCMREVGGK